MNDRKRMSETPQRVESADFSMLSDDDLYWFNEGTHRHLGEKLGAHASPWGHVVFGVGPQRDRGLSDG